MTLRDVNTPGSRLTTSNRLGEVRDDPRTRAEFFDLVHNGDYSAGNILASGPSLRA